MEIRTYVHVCIPYCAGAYFSAKLLFDILPLRVVPPAFFALFSYWMVGLHPSSAPCILWFIGETVTSSGRGMKQKGVDCKTPHRSQSTVWDGHALSALVTEDHGTFSPSKCLDAYTSVLCKFPSTSKLAHIKKIHTSSAYAENNTLHTLPSDRLQWCWWVQTSHPPPCAWP